MSGGSFDYLFSRDSWNIWSHEAELERMRDVLSGLGYAADAARETAEVLLVMRQTNARLDMMILRLQGIWKAVEWWKSCDWSEESVKAALEKYRK